MIQAEQKGQEEESERKKNKKKQNSNDNNKNQTTTKKKKQTKVSARTGYCRLYVNHYIVDSKRSI